MSPRILFPLPEKEGGYRRMVRCVADHECVPNAGQTIIKRFPQSGTRTSQNIKEGETDEY